MAKRVELKSLKPHHRAIARDVALGMRVGDLAEKHCMTTAGIRIIINSPLFKKEAERIAMALDEDVIDAAKELRSLQGRSVEIIAEELMQNQSSKERTRTAFEVLDRTGLHPRQDPKIDNRKLTIISVTPRPGDDPADAEKNLGRIQEMLDNNEAIDLEANNA